jgi:hypothetical protein
MITKTLPLFFRVKVFAIMKIKSLFGYEGPGSGPDGPGCREEPPHGHTHRPDRQLNSPARPFVHGAATTQLRSRTSGAEVE